jgi:hypothetical protein
LVKPVAIPMGPTIAIDFGSMVPFTVGLAAVLPSMTLSLCDAATWPSADYFARRRIDYQWRNIPHCRLPVKKMGNCSAMFPTRQIQLPRV